MGLFTPGAQVWYPETSDTAEINVLLSTMASSIEDGLGARMAKQEKTKSFLVNLPASSTVDLVNQTEKTIPFSINGSGFNNGFTLNSNGTISITEAGVYFFSLTALTSASNNPGFLQLYLKKNGVTQASIISNYGYSGTSYVASATTSAALVCAAGDVILGSVFVSNANGPLRISAGGGSDYTIMTGALLKAL